MRLIISLFVLQVALPAVAETCKYMDSEGHITYSNVPIKNAKKVSCFDTPAAVAPPPAAAPDKPSARKPHDPTQTGRRTAANSEEELTREQSSLDKQKSLGGARRNTAWAARRTTKEYSSVSNPTRIR
jgi:hypothetical protein